jgi:hypothetical protein
LKKNYEYIAFILLGAVFICLPNQNANIDSWYYAACVKHGFNLINSHHLLFNIWGSLFHEFLTFFYPKVTAIESLNILNAISSTLTLFVLNHLLKILGQNKEGALLLSLSAGVCFGFMRFATDAETYILPILFSILSTYYYFQPKRYLFIGLSAFFSVMAVCTHQLHIWWTLAIYIGVLLNKDYTKNNKKIYSLILFAGVIIYFLIYYFSSKNFTFLNFILGEYNKGNAGIDFSLKALILTLINSFRTVFQVHGLIYHFVLKHLVGSLIIIFSEIFIVGLIVSKRKHLFIVNRQTENNSSKYIFLIAILFHLTFAFLSSGNAEFMAMLPILIVAFFGVSFKIQADKTAFLIPLVIFIWNLNFGLIPSRFENTNQVNTQTNFTQKHKKDYFIWSNKPLVENILTYQNGFYETYNFTKIDSIDVLLARDIKIFTDLKNEQTNFSREAILNNDLKTKTLNGFHLSKVDSFTNLYGINYIYQIKAIE